MEEESKKEETRTEETRTEDAAGQKATEEKTPKYAPELVKCMNALAYVWILFFLPLAVTPEAPSSRFHANQGLVNLLFAIILNVAAWIVGLILTLIPGIGEVLAKILMVLVELVCLLFTILGIVWAATDQQKELPVIGKIRLIK